MNGKLHLLIFCAIYLLLTEEAALKSDDNKVSRKCTKCPPGWGAVKKCKGDSDTQCIRCTPGKNYSPHYSSKSPCWLCSQCGVGLYKSHKCSPVKDTICSECISYLDHRNLSRNADFLVKCSYLFLE